MLLTYSVFDTSDTLLIMRPYQIAATERALQELDIPELDPDRAFSWSPGLFAARAAVLEELGRLDEAAQWQRRAEIAEDVIGTRDADSETLLIEEIDEVELDDDEIDDLDPDGEDAVAPAAAESESDAEPELATEIAPAPAPASVQDEVDETLAEAGIDDAAGDAPDAESTR